MLTFKEYLLEGGVDAERQERGIINTVKSLVKANGGKPISIKGIPHKVVDAFKKDKSEHGKEPYTDVVLKTQKGEEINISCKGPSAPSLAGGGLKGIELILPGIASRFLRKAYQAHIKKGLKKGQKVPDIYGKISDNDKKLLVVGTKQMGGPINYMYIGPMDIKFDRSSMSFNGSFIKAEVYAAEHDFYFRLRARRKDQTFDPKATFKDGTPKIYGVSPIFGDSAGRIVVTDRPAKAREAIKF